MAIRDTFEQVRFDGGENPHVYNKKDGHYVQDWYYDHVSDAHVPRVPVLVSGLNSQDALRQLEEHVEKALGDLVARSPIPVEHQRRLLVVYGEPTWSYPAVVTFEFGAIVSDKTGGTHLERHLIKEGIISAD